MKLLLLTCILTAISIGSTVFAAVEYTPIVSIPRINGNEFSTKEYIQAIYFLAIAAAALMAVVKIIYGGVQYMLDGIVTHKEQAKKEIQGALFGLLIVLSAVLLLNTINPNLTKLNIFADAPSLEDINASKIPPIIEYGDTIDPAEVGVEELEAFKDACKEKGWVINNVVNGANGHIILSCDSAKDHIATHPISCTGTKCTCDYSGTGGNRGTCMAKCQTTPREGFTYTGVTDISSTVLQCNYTKIVDPVLCSDIPIAYCLTNMFETMCETSQPICKRVDSDNYTTLYGFK